MAAKPDLDDGWLPYAHELDAALAVADFTKGARIVLREVFAQIFGIAKRKAASVNATDIAARSGFKRPNVSRAIKELTDSRVLVLQDDGSYRFNKDYETWLMADGRTAPSGTPRITSDEASYCRHAPMTALAYKNGFGVQKSVSNGIHDNRQKCIQPDTGGVSNRIQKCIQLDTQNVSNGIHIEVSPYRNGRGIELERGEREKNASDAGVAQDASSPMTIEALLAEVDAVFGKPAITARVREEIGAIIEKLGDRLDCFLAGLKQAKRSKTKITSLIGFSIYQGQIYKRTGIPPEPLEFIPDAAVSTRAEKSRVQDAGFAAALAEIEEEY